MYNLKRREQRMGREGMRPAPSRTKKPESVKSFLHLSISVQMGVGSKQVSRLEPVPPHLHSPCSANCQRPKRRRAPHQTDQPCKCTGRLLALTPASACPRVGRKSPPPISAAAAGKVDATRCVGCCRCACARACPSSLSRRRLCAKRTEAVQEKEAKCSVKMMWKKKRKRVNIRGSKAAAGPNLCECACPYCGWQNIFGNSGLQTNSNTYFN
jgi:hypothetical protein